MDPLEEARASVAAAPDDVEAHLRLGAALLGVGQPHLAIEQFTAALARDPTNVHGLEGAAQACVAAGDATRAEGFFRLLSALSGNSSPTPPSAAIGNHLPRAELGSGELPPLAPEAFALEQPMLTLRDVAGMEAVKHRLNVAFLGPLKNPELSKLYGKSLRGGLLLFGPPGCGKTFIARATAGELGARFVSIGLSDVLDMWFGESEHRLHELFETARRTAPTVLFFDELDALGQKRSQLRHQHSRNLVAQLLAELDGVDRTNTGVFVLGATNHPWDVDSALLRPGRFDRRLAVLPPDITARAAILRFHLAQRPTQDLDPNVLAARTDGYSGADLAHVCESAAELAMEASLASGHARPITMADLQRALRDVRPSTRPWFETARNYVLYANESGIYDDLLDYMRSAKLV